MTNALHLQAQRFLTFSRNRIVEANALDKTAIAAIARISYDYVVKRTILRTAAGKTNDYHIKTYLKVYEPSAKHLMPDKGGADFTTFHALNATRRQSMGY